MNGILHSKGLLIGLLAVNLILLTSSLWLDTNVIEIERYNHPSQVLAEHFEGMRIAHITDFHTRYEGYLERDLIRKLTAIKPDLIFVTGDLVNDNDNIEYCGELLKQINNIAPTVVILGNHDHHFMNITVDTEQLCDTVRGSGACLLVNQALEFRRGQDSLYIVGLDDNHLGYDNYQRAVKNIPEDSAQLLLVHCPDIGSEINLDSVCAIFCGHTHGGQIILPIIGQFLFNTLGKYNSGFYSVDNHEDILFVNRGIGASSIPLRYGNSPEIAVFEF